MKKRIMAITLALTLALPITPAFAATQPVTMDIFQSVMQNVESNYYKPVTRDALLQASLKGMLESLDPYSEYYSSTEYKSFTDALEGSFVGIGIIVNEHPYYINVSQVYPNSPAQRAGIQKDDVIYSVNGQDLTPLTFRDRIDKLLGPEKTTVTVGVLRGTEKLSVTMVREKIIVNPIEYKLLDNQLGYIRILEFSTSSSKYFEEAITALQKQKIKGLVLDLRDNPGGDIESVLRISEWLVPKGTKLITVKYRVGEDSYRSEREPISIPLSVLINSNSASGSEMLAGIVKDNKAGTVIGTKSYGKGVAQSIYDLKGGEAGGYKMTIAEFFTTALVKIQDVGIMPNIVIDQPKAFTDEKLKNLAVVGDPLPVKLGGAGLNVIAVEQRLGLMGYTLATDGVFDQQLADTLRQMGIDQDGILTQAEANQVKNLFEQTSQSAKEDVQLKKAIEVLQKQ